MSRIKVEVKGAILRMHRAVIDLGVFTMWVQHMKEI